MAVHMSAPAVALVPRQDSLTHTWIQVSPLAGVRQVELQVAEPVPGGTKQRFQQAVNGRRFYIRANAPVWVFVKEHGLEGDHEYLIVCVDHQDGGLSRDYEYRAFRRYITILERS